ncbi:hypothetical protein SPRG_00623 [Saprolegnia parasitica CBS 223.65]|uniref:Uncharacterized protein n=1 Tax=Saprolegnia parasitica (strain CBS 223.65) TaxID=695850 RepID=A0A067CZ67_SAPPC|nr:hypothetical protein SPRG_00623 [Saprolegnia parasitica CBS 223.65]KDO34560.1 hypothetical protein SPRG_00623 [Saprolegnia parasitica CBS 223.65]|eukprot:XP_012194237.1 hypothetical protein SPRG_00623 [Saprolegnia parasitica CBS 223.65]
MSADEDSATDDSVPLNFLLGDRVRFYRNASGPIKVVAQPRPRTPTDFTDMSKREREVRAKMVLDPINGMRTFLTAVKMDEAPAPSTSPSPQPTRSFQSRAERKQREKQRLQVQRLQTSISWKGDKDETLAQDRGLDTSHGYMRPKAFLPVAISRAPTLHSVDKLAGRHYYSGRLFPRHVLVIQIEVEKARAKVDWRLHHAQRVLQVTKAQQEYAQQVLSQAGTAREREKNRKHLMEAKRKEIERRKHEQGLELAAAKLEKEQCLNDLHRDVDERNRVAKMRKGNMVSKLKDRVEYFQRKGMNGRVSNQYKLQDDVLDAGDDVPLPPADAPTLSSFKPSRRRPRDKYTIDVTARPKPVFGGGFHVEPAKCQYSDDENDANESDWEVSKAGDIQHTGSANQ